MKMPMMKFGEKPSLSILIPPVECPKDLVVIKPVANSGQRMTAGNIILPDTITEDHDHGVIVAIGGGAYSTFTAQKIPMDVRVADLVAYTKKAGWGIRFEGEEYRVIREPDVHVILYRDVIEGYEAEVEFEVEDDEAV